MPTHFRLEPTDKALLLAQLASTLFMTGLIWTIQVVHYPLFARVGAAQFQAYHASHTTLISLVVGVPMIVEALTTVGLLLSPLPGAPAWSVWLAAALLAVVWGATALLQIPAHDALSRGFDVSAHTALVLGNWLRTLAWSARSALLLWWLSRALPGLPRRDLSRQRLAAQERGLDPATTEEIAADAQPERGVPPGLADRERAVVRRARVAPAMHHRVVHRGARCGRTKRLAQRGQQRGLHLGGVGLQVGLAPGRRRLGDPEGHPRRARPARLVIVARDPREHVAAGPRRVEGRREFVERGHQRPAGEHGRRARAGGPRRQVRGQQLGRLLGRERERHRVEIARKKRLGVQAPGLAPWPDRRARQAADPRAGVQRDAFEQAPRQLRHPGEGDQALLAAPRLVGRGLRSLPAEARGPLGQPARLDAGLRQRDKVRVARGEILRAVVELGHPRLPCRVDPLDPPGGHPAARAARLLKHDRLMPGTLEPARAGAPGDSSAHDRDPQGGRCHVPRRENHPAAPGQALAAPAVDLVSLLPLRDSARRRARLVHLFDQNWTFCMDQRERIVRSMRRAEFSWGRDEAVAFLAAQPVVRLASSLDDGTPVLRTVHGVVVDGWLCFHSAPKGEKTGLIGRPAVLCAEEIVAVIPSTFFDPVRACPATTYYRSVQAHGTLEAIEQPDLKARVLQALMEKLQPEGGYVPIEAAHPYYRAPVRGLLIAGVRLERVDGKAKLAQNRSPDERAALLSSLWRRGDPGDTRAIELIRAANPGTPTPAFLRGPEGASLHAWLDGSAASEAAAMLDGTYWNDLFSREELTRAHRGSEAWVGARDEAGRLVATARAITDGAKNGWVYDVCVAPAWRGRGLGKAVVGLLLDHPLVRGVRRVFLGTRDAQGLYAGFGFVPRAALPPRPYASTDMVLMR